MRRALLVLPLLVPALVAGGMSRGADLPRPRLTLVPPAHADVLVVAPHPDDDVLGAGGGIQQARAVGKSVVVVYMTNGDGYPDAAGALARKTIYELKRRDFLLLSRA